MPSGSSNNVSIKLHWFDGQITSFEQRVFNSPTGPKEKFYSCNLDSGGWYSLAFMVCKFDEPSSHGLGTFRKKNLRREKNALISLMDIERMANQGS